VSTLGKATLIGPLTRRWGEVVVARVSLIASSLGFLVLLIAGEYATVLLAVGFFILSKTFLRTALLSLASRRAHVGQGVLMGLGNSFINLGRIVGPVWAGYIFDVDLRYPYLTGALIMMGGFVVSLLFLPRQPALARAGREQAAG
jgi:DHA1 family multidrug resistance protein-like MFS transporter